MGTAEIVEAIKTAGAIGALAVMVAALVSGRVITRTHHDEITSDLRKQLADKDADLIFWRDQALSGTDLADRAVDLATRRALSRPSRHTGGGYAGTD